MTITIKSNTVVTNANKEFDYYTGYGIVDRQTANFVNGLNESGYALSDPEFTAISKFVGNLKEKRIWDEVYEVYPMMGNSAASAAVKLKSLNENSKMLPQYGLDDSYFEFSGGKLLGKKVTGTSISTQPSFNTQLKVSQLPSKYVGYHIYMGEGVAHTQSLRQVVMGVKQKNGTTNADYSYAAININSNEAALTHMSSTAGYAGIGNDMALYSFVSKVGVFDVSAIATYYKNGALLGQSAAATINAANLEAEVGIGFLGSNAPYTVPSNSTNAYSGKVRFGCITSGTLSAASIMQLSNEITQLLTALGKI